MMYGALICLQLLCLLNVASIGKYEQSDFIRLESKLQSDKSINEILQSWRREHDAFESYQFEIDIEEENPTYNVKAKSKCKIALMMRPNGNCLVKMDNLTERDVPVRSILFHDKTIAVMEYNLKSVFISELTLPHTRQSMVDLCDTVFPAVPFFMTERSALEKKFRLNQVQKDEHYTWIRFEPRTALQMRDISIAQIGVVNYSNSISSKHFPLKIM